MNDELEQRRGVLFAGLPGAGKTYAANFLQSQYGGTVISAGDMIRNEWHDRYDSDPSSSEGGDFAATLREEQGDGFFASLLTAHVLDAEPDIEYPLWIDSFRHINGVRAAREFLTTSQLLWIEAGRHERLSRIQERGRDDEAGFMMVDLLRRDAHELDGLGTNTILDSESVDKVVPNSATVHTFHVSLRGAVWDAFKE